MCIERWKLLNKLSLIRWRYQRFLRVPSYYMDAATWIVHVSKADLHTYVEDICTYICKIITNFKNECTCFPRLHVTWLYWLYCRKKSIPQVQKIVTSSCAFLNCGESRVYRNWRPISDPRFQR